MKLSEEIQQNISTISSALDEEQRRRLKHLAWIVAILYVAVFIIVGGIIYLIATASLKPETGYSLTVLFAIAPQVVIVLLVILGLILHGMSIGKLASSCIGLLRSNVEILQQELSKLTHQVMPATGAEDGSWEEIDRILAMGAEPYGTGEGTDDVHRAKRTRLVSTARQLRMLASELGSTRMAVQHKHNWTDVSIGAYGFALLCALSGAAVFFWKVDGAVTARVILLGISATCAFACYIILKRPTTVQFYIEDVLTKLGFSIRDLAERINARDRSMPGEFETEQLLESIPGEAKGMARGTL